VRVIRQIETGLLAPRGHLFGWVPVCLGIGIGVYFAIGQEPDIIQLATLGLGCLCVLVLSRLGPAAISPLLIGLALIGVGFGLAKTRTTIKEAPVLGFRYYGPIEGRIVNIDRSGSDAVRLTLDRVNLDRMSPAKTPARVRVSLHGDWPSIPIRPGDMVMATGHLSPPSGPAEPGGFDFQRHTWFLQVGAVGYSHNPVVRLSVPARMGWRLWVFQIRHTLSQAVQAEIPGEKGAFAAAIMTGNRTGMGQGTIADLRAENLAHLLAILGLYMGLLTAFIFGAVRYG
jgi:competence protein ComEC